MNEINILHQLLGNSTRAGNGEYIFICPVCHKKKLYYNPKTQFYNCFKAGCIQGKGIRGFVKRFYPNRINDFFEKNKIKGYIQLDAYDEEIIEDKEPQIHLFNDFVSLLSNEDDRCEEAIQYLKKRGIFHKHIKLYNIGITGRGNKLRILIPSYSTTGNLNYYVARTLSSTVQPKYINPKINKTNIIVFESLIDWNIPVVLTEGVFDAMKIFHNAIPILGGSMNEGWILFKKLLYLNNKIFICFDNDKAGILGAVRTAEKLFENGVENLYYIDVSPFHDIGEMDKRDFLTKKKDAILIDEFWLMEKKMEVI